MSQETLHHLNTNTLIGYTAKRGTAWHYRAEYQGEERNHYEEAIPVEDVRRRLFNWAAESRPLVVEEPASHEVMTHLNTEGLPVRWRVLNGRQAIARSDTHHVMGIFADGYERHQYGEWLLNSVANILDAGLAISSAGLLREGAVAWVEVSAADTISTPQGVDFRPNLLATTSFDGSIATTYKRTITATVCDNTRDLALSESGKELKVKHSRHSKLRLSEARDALEIVHQTGQEFAAEVAQLCAIKVTNHDWAAFLDSHVPMVDSQTKEPLAGRALTLAANKRDNLQRLYRRDPRVEPWSDTAYGVIQAINTYEHHEGTMRGANRAERNMLRTVTGDFSKVDRRTWQQLERVLTA